MNRLQEGREKPGWRCPASRREQRCTATPIRKDVMIPQLDHGRGILDKTSSHQPGEKKGKIIDGHLSKKGSAKTETGDG